MSKSHGAVLNAGSDLTELTHRCARSFIAEYYHDEVEMFDLFWGAMKNHIAAISERPAREPLPVDGVGLATQSETAKLLLTCCASISEFFLKVSHKDTGLSSVTLEKMLTQVLKQNRVNRISPQLGKQMIGYLIPFTQELLRINAGESDSIFTGSQNRRVIITGDEDSRTENEIRATLFSKEFDLAVDEEKQIVTLKGHSFDLPPTSILVLAALLKNFKKDKHKNEGLNFAGFLGGVWNQADGGYTSEKSKIFWQVNNELKKKYPIFRDAIKNVRGKGFKFRLTRRIKNFFLAVKKDVEPSIAGNDHKL